ncbi:protein arginine N-methyltransferase 1 [Pseudonocardia sediminis]|uniref:Protein arginine N-methyltransferase 1 n=1 Tax=Pseudonocardia sediminis TaxID=1397368 RepID=A0A4Q7V568_PSEST|nr:SAM-dependent methyltransferase [Pseudonocardia sediminis]RZT88644.1 protein arginine N-methyltransferase 1 [Pseudonocardia sediminis]
MSDNLMRLDTPGHDVVVQVADRAESPLGVVIASLGEYPVYDEAAYALMGRDEVRNAAYRAAIAATVEGRTVVDIGTGREALWAVTSARAGARHVYAIEEMPDNAALARRAVAEAGFADRITVLEGSTGTVELPERVEVCISEIIGTIGGSEGAAAVLNGAAERYMLPGAAYIPLRCATTIGAVDLSGIAPEGITAYERDHVRYLEMIFAAMGGPFDVRTCVSGLRCTPYLTDQAEVEHLELTGAATASGSDARTLTVRRDGRLHGLSLGVRLWVDAGQDPIDSTDASTSWFPVWVPVSAEGVPVRAGDRVRVEFGWRPAADGIHPDYRLSGRIERADGVPAAFTWDSPYRGSGFRGDDFHRTLFPAPAPADPAP